MKILLALTVAKTSVEQPETDSSTVMEDDIEDWNSNEEGAGTKGEIFYLSAITMHHLITDVTSYLQNHRLDG